MASQRLTILSHNVFWFQGAPFGSAEPGPPHPEAMRRLAAMYDDLGADVVCVQEVQSLAAAGAFARELGVPANYCPGNAFPQYGGASFGGQPIDDSSPPGAAAQRFWQAVRCDDTELTVCNLHLPSGRQEGRERAAAIRVNELSAMFNRLSERRPDVLCGDFNEPPGGPVGELLAGQGYVDAAVVAGKEELPTSLGGKRGDYLWLRETIAERLVDYGAQPKDALAWPDEAGKEYLSDHLPLWVVLERA